jgi:hypothetical protein
MTRVTRNVKGLCAPIDQADIVRFHIVTADTSPGVLEVEMVRIVAFAALFLAMTVEGWDWYISRHVTAAQVEDGTVTIAADGGPGAQIPPK